MQHGLEHVFMSFTNYLPNNMDEDQKDVQEIETPEVETPTNELLDEISERTKKEFEKLKESNKQLKEEIKAMKDVISSLTPDPVEQTPETTPIPQAQDFKNINQEDINKVYEGLIDDQGFLDGNKLMETLETMDSRTKKAEEISERVAKQAELERIAREGEIKSQEIKDLHEKYPSLDPDSESFDRDFYDAVRNEMIGQMFEGGQDPQKAADKWFNKLYSQDDMNKKEKESVEKAEDNKRNINATMPRSSALKGFYAKEESETLRQNIRTGKKGALAELLRRREQGKA